MAKTTFSLTGDYENTAYPENFGYASGTEATEQGLDRYSKYGSRSYQYPLSDNQDGFYVPMMHFTLLDAFGNRIAGSSPQIKFRVPNNFNVTNFSDYSRADNIFGAGMEGVMTNIQDLLGGENFAKSGAENANEVLKYGAGAAEAFLFAIEKSLGGVQGFIQSGGLNGVSQFEFSNRIAINPYAQLLYKGPQFRKYQIPLLIKPRNKAEADTALNIIKIFKLASSPTVKNRPISFTGFRGTQITGNLQSFTFGYPHLTQFDIKFRPPDTNQNLNIFRSKPCAIESITVDYGGTKMAFFEDGIPAEMTMTLQLSEVSVRTLGDAKTDTENNRTIL